MTPLCILHLEDDPQDAARVQNTLAEAGVVCQFTRVATLREYEAVLCERSFDVILSGYGASKHDTHFDGSDALRQAREICPQIPFLFVSQLFDPEVMLEALRSGAYDFISKRRLVRLAPAIERALRETNKHIELKQAHADQKRLCDGLHAVVAAADELVACTDLTSLLRRGVELARESLGIERCSLYLFDGYAKCLRGTYGTDFEGQTTDERNIAFPFDDWWQRRFTPPEPGIGHWLVAEDERYNTYDAHGQLIEKGQGWIVATPLLAEASLIGGMFNDTALSGAPVDEIQQELLAVYCSFLAKFIAAQRTTDKLRRITARAHCILFDASLEQQSDGHLHWMMRYIDEEAAQRVLPLRTTSECNYFKAWHASRHPDDNKRIAENPPENAAVESGQLAYQQEYRCIDCYDVTHWLLEEVVLEPQPPLPDGRLCWHAVGVCTDITARKMAEEQLRRDAFHDRLTDLPNRSLFLDRLNRSFNQARRREHLFAVLFLDLDNFKGVNDNLGHEVGDDLLVAVARRLERCLRPGDTAARFGGDEFAILLDGIRDVGDATRVAERVLHELRQPFYLGRHYEEVTERPRHEVLTAASVGVALSRVPGEDDSGYERAEDLLRDADAAMYRAKSMGRDHYELFDTVMHARAQEQLCMENDLRRALGRDEFVLHYQPVWDIAAERLRGVEALLRWNHPTRGILAPDDFMNVAEEAGLFHAIGDWTLREACRQLRAWQVENGGQEWFVSVNLSARQFTQRDLPQRVATILQESGLPPRCLKLEFSEGVFMQHAALCARVLPELKALGVLLSLDDFGTAFSSLSHLQQLPFDELKIDRSFVSRHREDSGPGAIENAGVVRAIVALSHALGVRVTAEGVESAAQWDELREMGCSSAQGYFMNRPLPAASIAALFSASEATSPAPVV